MHARYKVSDVEALKNELQLFPATERESRQVGLKDAMKVLAPVLRDMRDRRGYTSDQLLALLREKGIRISKSSLADHLRTKRRPNHPSGGVEGAPATDPASIQKTSMAGPIKASASSAKAPASPANPPVLSRPALPTSSTSSPSPAPSARTTS